MRSFLKEKIPNFAIEYIKNFIEKFKILSIKCAIKEQKLSRLYEKLKKIVPDIKNQYSTFEISGSYLNIKVRGQHAFQMSMIEDYFKLNPKAMEQEPSVVDIGDSSGTHLKYMRSLFGKCRALSVNCDNKAVKKIQEQGMEAIHAKAEDLGEKNIKADILLSFEMLEHLSDPITFLHSISKNVKCNAFIITVPYLYKSRVGLHSIRNQNKTKTYAENTHYFELSPEDWALIFKHSGWKIITEKIYLQYPIKHWLRAFKTIWKNTDFEGFYGVILERDDTWSSRYNDW